MNRPAFLLTLVAFLQACNPVFQPQTPPEPVDPTVTAGAYTLKVMETTDIHGYIVNNDGGTIHYKLAYIADKANDIRCAGQEYDTSRLLLLDGGDLYQGNSVSNLQNGWPMFAAIDLMDYDAVALGNHEFDWGISQTVDQDATVPDYVRDGVNVSNQVPVVCANLFQDGTRVPWTMDYVIVEKSAENKQGETVPVKIGVVGFAVNYAGSIMTSKFKGLGYTINADFSIANRIAKSLETSGECDATVLLIHGAADDAAEKLGEDTVFDLVLGGHSHQTQNGRSKWGVPYLQGGCYGQYYAGATMRFLVDENGTVSFSGVSEMGTPKVSTSEDRHDYDGQNENELDDELLTLSDEAVDAVSAQMTEVIGYIYDDASKTYYKESDNRSSAMGNWMCDIIRRIGDADVSFVNGGGIRTAFYLNGNDRREITVANVYEIFPFSNTTYIYSITYTELLELLNYALTAGGRALFTGMVGIDCYFDGDMVVSLRKEGELIYSDGKWQNDWASRSLVLAVSEYLATTSRRDYTTGIENPLLEWNQSSRLLFNDQVDNENAIRVLREEAKASGGHLYIDTRPHFISL